jgi:hypothetical protein
MKFILAVLFFFSFLTSVISQTEDTTDVKKSPKDSIRKSADTIKVPFDRNMIIKEEIVSGHSDITSYNEFIWSDKRSLAEILREYPGFWVNTFGTASRGMLSYNGLYRVGVIRDGLQINDLFDQNFDAENISVSEIDKIEEISPPLSFIYGLNSTKTINIVSKNKFQPNLFTQLRYSQDRDGALFADVFLNFPISRKMNFLFGINNHGSDGHYENTDFNFWRGRMKFDYYPYDKINFKISYYQNKLQRGLNEGLYTSTKDTLIDPNLATSENTDSYERIYNYYGDIKVTGNFFNNKSALTNLSVYTQNSLREYWDEENRTNPNEIYKNKNYHGILYGIELNQSAAFVPAKYFKLDLTGGLKASYYLYDVNYSQYNADSVTGNASQQINIYNFYTRFDIAYHNLKFIPGMRVDYNNGNVLLNAGGEINYRFNVNKESCLIFYGGGSNSVYGIQSSAGYSDSDIFNKYFSDTRLDYIEYGVRLNYGIFYADLKQFYQSNSFGYSALNNNISTGFNCNMFEGYVNLNLTDKDKLNAYSPGVFIKSDFAYKNSTLFKNKLNLKTGFNVKFVSEMSQYTYSQETGQFYYSSYNVNYTVLDQFMVDLYVGARIGKANINLTLANLFNSLFYDTQLYPYDNRGGFLRSISRFSITWDFWN